MVPGPKSVEHYTAEGKWMDESELVEVMDHLEQRAVGELQSSPHTIETAKLVQDALLLGFSFLHFPPVRPGVLQEVVVQLDAASPPRCAHLEECATRDAAIQKLRCIGNVLVRKAPRQFTLSFSHHKNVRKVRVAVKTSRQHSVLSPGRDMRALAFAR